MPDALATEVKPSRPTDRRDCAATGRLRGRRHRLAYQMLSPSYLAIERRWSTATAVSSW